MHFNWVTEVTQVRTLKGGDTREALLESTNHPVSTHGDYVFSVEALEGFFL